MSLAIAVRIAGSSVRSIAGHGRRAHTPRGSRRPRPSRRSPSRRCRARAACRRARAPSAARRRRRPATSRLSLSVCARSAPTSSAFISAERRTSSTTGSSSASCSPRNGYRKLEAPASWTLARRRAREQAAVLEEHVHELPQHVVERLDQLLADERVGRRRLELPLGARSAQNATVRQPRARASASARAPPRPRPRRRRTPSRCRRPREQLDLRAELAALAGQARSPAAPACRRSPDARTRPRRDARPSAPPAIARTRSAAPRARTARPSDGTAGPAARPRPRRTVALASVRSSQQRREPVRGDERFAHTGDLPGARRSASSHSRHAPTPSPVRALRTIVSTSGCTWSML